MKIYYYLVKFESFEPKLHPQLNWSFETFKFLLFVSYFNLYSIAHVYIFIFRFYATLFDYQ